MSSKRLTVNQLLIRHDIEMMIIAILLLFMVVLLYWALLRTEEPEEPHAERAPREATIGDSRPGHAWVNGKQIW